MSMGLYVIIVIVQKLYTDDYDSTGCLKNEMEFEIPQAVVQHHKRPIYKQFNFYIGRKNSYLAFQ
jgi:hypothetical protein